MMDTPIIVEGIGKKYRRYHADRAWTLQTDGDYVRAIPPDGVPPLNSQRFLLDWYATQHET